MTKCKFKDDSMHDMSHYGNSHSHSKTAMLFSIGCFQSIKTGVLLIFSFITGDKTEFLSPMIISNEYIQGI